MSRSYTVNLRLPVPPPNTTMALPSAFHHNRDLALQKYLVLQDQHESLRQHLDSLRPLEGFSPRTSTTSNTPSTSPTRDTYMPSVFSSASGEPLPRQRHHGRRTSLPLPPRGRLGGSKLATVAELDSPLLETEEAKLSDVNEGIKRALTELLNCDAVRTDQAFRTWVQCRLMETERELRSGRRRRSNP